MSIPDTPWIQSLLLISGRRPPGLEQLSEELQQRFGGQAPSVERFQVDSRESGRLAEPLPPNVPSMHTISQVASARVSAHMHLTDLTREGPFWPASLQPRLSLVEVLGNGVVVDHLPAPIPFVLYAIVCGKQSVEFAWELNGPHQQNAIPRTLFASSPKPVRWQSVPLFPQLGIGVAQVKEAAQPVVEEEGLYFVTAKLNNLEVNRIPLSVWVASEPTP